MRPAARQILTFLALVFAFSSVPYALIIHSGHVASGGGLAVRLIMWCPAMAAFLTCALFRIDLATLGWNWRPAKYEGLAYLLPWIYALPVYLACWLVIKGSFAFSAYAARAATSWGFDKSPGFPAWGLGLLLTASIGIIGSLSTALGEEIGWRGFLLPRLTGQFGFTIGCLFSGIIWAVWHFPPAVIRRLQLRHRQALRPGLFHRNGHRERLPDGLAAAQVGQPVALRHAAR